MSNKIDLSGKNAVVTGGAQGIGRAVVERFLDSGAAVAIWDMDAKLAEKTASELKSRGRVAAVPVDVTKLADVERARDDTVKALGGIHILVNNAGIAGPTMKMWDVKPEEWTRTMNVNVDSQFYCCRAIVPLMIAQKYGRIVNVASIAGKEGNPTLVPYSTAKAGVIGLTKALAKEVATKGILVHAVAPAVIGTELLKQMTKETVDMLVAKIPMGRVGTPAEVAALVAWLASEECTFTTGAVHDLSGGRATY